VHSLPSGEDLFIPRYRAVASGAWEMRIAGPLFAPGYWSAPVLVESVPVLLRGRETWMSITPLEIESQEIGIKAAHGHVAVLGLGMGWAAAAAAARPAVKRITVVEADPDVLALHREIDVFAQLPGACRDKLRIVRGDGCAWRPEAPVDLLMADIWLPLVSEGRVDEVRRMQANVEARAIYFWGQELEIARHAAAAGRSLDAAGIAATVAAWALPLIGPGTPDYAARTRDAARRWMRGRWLPGSAAPF
jgi:hypothetical protein